MKTSAAGRQAIMQREGFRNRAYRDSRGLWTIGCGHLTQPPNFTRFSVWTNAQVDAALAHDLAEFELAVNEAVHVQMTQNMFDAMVSLAFNIGAGGFRGSAVVHRLNAGEKSQAADAFMMWDKPAVLANRRAAERRQFLTP